MLFLRQKLKLYSESVAELFLCRYNCEGNLQKSLEHGESRRTFAVSKVNKSTRDREMK
jgi:hypothetical protein